VPIENLEDEAESCLRSELGVAKRIFRRRSWEGPEVPIENLEDEAESCLRSESGGANRKFRR